jgi:hypothetical protein
MMPLPNIANGTTPQCSATNRKTGNRCLNPAAFGMATCRYHGARTRATVRHGAHHPQYRHGMETLDAKRQRSEALSELKALYKLDLTELGHFVSRTEQAEGGIIEQI